MAAFIADLGKQLSMFSWFWNFFTRSCFASFQAAGIESWNMVIKNVDSHDKWTFRLDLCEYLFLCIPTNEIEPACPGHIYHLVLLLQRTALFQPRRDTLFSLFNTISKLKSMFSTQFFDWISVKHHRRSVWCFLVDKHMVWPAIRAFMFSFKIELAVIWKGFCKKSFNQLNHIITL